MRGMAETMDSPVICANKNLKTIIMAILSSITLFPNLISCAPAVTKEHYLTRNKRWEKNAKCMRIINVFLTWFSLWYSKKISTILSCIQRALACLSEVGRDGIYINRWGQIPTMTWLNDEQCLKCDFQRLVQGDWKWSGFLYART